MSEGEGRGGGHTPPQILEDQVTLSQPGAADYAIIAYQLLHAPTPLPPDFQTFRHPWSWGSSAKSGRKIMRFFLICQEILKKNKKLAGEGYCCLRVRKVQSTKYKNAI